LSGQIKKKEEEKGKMKNKLASIAMLIILLSTITPILLRMAPVNADSGNSPSLVVYDAKNRVNATLGIKSVSKMTAKGFIKNVGAIALTNLLTSVFFKEGVGGVQTSDLSFEWSLDCSTWYPVDPSEVKYADVTSGYQVELIIGPPGGETLNPGDNRTVYIRATFIQDLTKTSGYSMAVWSFNDANANRHWDAGETVYSESPPSTYDTPIRIDLSIVHTAEIEGTGQFYFNIQDAINAASPGQTIYAYPGTYNEAVTIDKALSVLSTSSADATIIDGSGVLLASSGLVKISATSGNVLFNGFTVRKAPAVGTTRICVLTRSSLTGPTYTISNNKIYGSNNASEWDDYGFYASYGKENIVFKNNLVTQTGANNVVLEVHTGSTDISFNTLDAGVWGADSIFFMTYDEFNVTSLQSVSQNTFDMGTGGPFDYDHRATAISFDTPGPAWGLGEAKFTNMVITGNTINNLKSNRRGIGFWNGGTGDNLQSPSITNNKINGVPGSSASYGIDFVGGPTSNAFLTCNTIKWTDVGIFMRTAGCAPGIKIQYNNIVGNTIGMDNTVGPTSAEARYNWWGDATGPYHSTNPGGLGNPVSDNVNFSPWLLKEKVLPFVHDVAVADVTATPAMVEIGGTVSISITVKNLGNCYENTTVTITYGSHIITLQMKDWVPGNATTFHYVWDTTGEGTCLHTIYALVNPVPLETYTFNNHRDTSVALVSYIPPSATLKAEPTSVIGVVGGTVRINITINSLDAYWDLNGFNIKLYYNTAILDATAISLGDFAQHFNLTLKITEKMDDAAGYVMVVYSWNPAMGHTPPYGSGVLATISFSVTAVGNGDLSLQDVRLSASANESKWCVIYSIPVGYTFVNSHIETKLPMLGDVNRDGTVDIYDVTTVCIAYDSTSNDPNWNPNADLAPEFGIIDIYDVVTVLINYGKTDP
jgi:hypothetical protein